MPAQELSFPSFPENSPSPIYPCAKGIPSPAPLVFTPVPPERLNLNCSNCDTKITPHHQCEAQDTDSSWEDLDSNWPRFKLVMSEKWTAVELISRPLARSAHMPPGDRPLSLSCLAFPCFQNLKYLYVLRLHLPVLLFLVLELVYGLLGLLEELAPAGA